MHTAQRKIKQSFKEFLLSMSNTLVKSPIVQHSNSLEVVWTKLRTVSQIVFRFFDSGRAGERKRELHKTLEDMKYIANIFQIFQEIQGKTI